MDNQPKAPAQDGPTFRNASNFFSTYTNSANVLVSNWDFSFVFGEFAELDDKTKRPVIEQKVAVKMSPQHAKAFLELLAKDVKQYEERFGAIRWEPIKERT